MRFILVPSFSGRESWSEVSQHALYCHYAGTSHYDNIVKFVLNSVVGDKETFGTHLLIKVKHEPEKTGE